jgi:hypothetical protein
LIATHHIQCDNRVHKLAQAGLAFSDLKNFAAFVMATGFTDHVAGFFVTAMVTGDQGRQHGFPVLSAAVAFRFGRFFLGLWHTLTLARDSRQPPYVAN